ncbi:S24/S26 family peptidase [Streptomyces sp. NPDC047022]|uniref:S24/S26 family peptidase n=1 Tax=Streptomyces sp. NPDC047022 TaxID=3155737 RepID=UPI0033E55538
MTGAGRSGVALAVGAGALFVAVRALRSRFALIRVTGSSMAPTFADGDRLLVRRTTHVRVGDPVVFRNPLVYGEGGRPAGLAGQAGLRAAGGCRAG